MGIEMQVFQDQKHITKYSIRSDEHRFSVLRETVNDIWDEFASKNAITMTQEEMIRFLKGYINTSRVSKSQFKSIFGMVDVNSQGEIDKMELAFLIMKLTGQGQVDRESI